MADGVFNFARGRIRELAMNGGAHFGVLLLKAAEADADLQDYDTVADLLAAAGNTEADFTNYARKTGLAATPAEDDVAEQASVDIPDQTWTSAGGTTDNSLVKLIVFYDTSQGGLADADLLPLTHHDFVHTTSGSDLTAQIASGGVYQSQ